MVRRSTSQARVSSIRCRRPKNRFAGCRVGSWNSTTRSRSLASVDVPRATEPNASRRLTSKSRQAGATASLMSSSLMSLPYALPAIRSSLDRMSSYAEALCCQTFSDSRQDLSRSAWVYCLRRQEALATWSCETLDCGRGPPVRRSLGGRQGGHAAFRRRAVGRRGGHSTFRHGGRATAQGRARGEAECPSPGRRVRNAECPRPASARCRACGTPWRRKDACPRSSTRGVDIPLGSVHLIVPATCPGGT